MDLNPQTQIEAPVQAKTEFKKKSYEILEKENYYLAKKNRNRRTNLHNLQTAYDRLLRNYTLMQQQRDWFQSLYRELIETENEISFDVPSKKWWQFWK